MDDEEILKAFQGLRDSLARKRERAQPPDATNVQTSRLYHAPWGEVIELPAEARDLEDENGSIVIPCSDGELVLTPAVPSSNTGATSMHEDDFIRSDISDRPVIPTRATSTLSVSAATAATNRVESSPVGKMWRFLRSAATLGCALAFAGLALGAVAGGALYWRAQAVQRANDTLAAPHVWPEQRMTTVGATLRLTTKWERESVWYQVHIDGYSPALQYAYEGGDGRFAISFLDAGGFEVFQVSIPLDEMTRMLRADGTPEGFHFRGSALNSADAYRKAKSIDLTWALREPPPPPSTVPARRNLVDAPQARWKDRSNWRQLKKGMSEDAVRALLGEPRKVDVLSVSTYWHYNYPYGGDVVFSSGAVVSWTEP